MDQAARLRADEFAGIRVQWERGLRDKVLKELDERGGAQELIRQQYSGRYPFELLQNANDAAVEQGVRGRAHFLLTDTALIVADDGSGFGDKQVRAICSLGRSSKDVGTAVGHKGLGFKSVGEFTDRPQVFSNETQFQFDGERLRREVAELTGPLPPNQRLPVYAFPFEVSEADLGPDAASVRRLRTDGFRTIIRLPLRNGADRETVAEHLVRHLRPRLLLFLPGIERVDLHGTGADFSAVVTRHQADGAQRVSLDTIDSAEQWLIYRREVVADPDVLTPLGDAWADIDMVRWAVAVPLAPDGQPRTDETFPLHVYFPTEEEPGLHVMVHAEWVLGMDRRHLAATPEAVPYNEWLLGQVAGSVEHVATDLVRRCDASAAAVTALVPAILASGAGAAALRRAWEQALAQARFLPVAEGSLARPAEVGLLPAVLPNIANAHRLAALDGERILRPDIETLAAVRAFLTGSVGLDEMATKDFLAALRPPRRETLALYYGFLVEWHDRGGRRLAAQLAELPCVLTVNGAVAAPGSQPVFLPRVRGDVSIPADLPVPIAEVPPVEGVELLLRSLSVRPFEWRDLISGFLLPIRPIRPPVRPNGTEPWPASGPTIRSDSPAVRVWPWAPSCSPLALPMASCASCARAPPSTSVPIGPGRAIWRSSTVRSAKQSSLPSRFPPTRSSGAPTATSTRCWASWTIHGSIRRTRDTWWGPRTIRTAAGSSMSGVVSRTFGRQRVARKATHTRSSCGCRAGWIATRS